MGLPNHFPCMLKDFAEILRVDLVCVPMAGLMEKWHESTSNGEIEQNLETSPTKTWLNLVTSYCKSWNCITSCHSAGWLKTLYNNSILDLQYIQNLNVFVVMTSKMFLLRMKRMTLTLCFRLTLYYPTIPDQEQIVQTYSNPFSNHECLGFVMIVGNVMIDHRSLFWGNHSKIIHILHIVDWTKSCTSWGWSFIPPFTGFYTSFRWLAGFLNHQQYLPVESVRMHR